MFYGNEKKSLLYLKEKILEKIKFKSSEMDNLRIFNREGLEVYEEDL